MLIIRNCRLVKELTEGYSEEYADILVQGRRIEAIKPVGYHLKGEYEEIHADGMTLIPGLFEMHAHLYGFIYNPYELQCMTEGKIIFGALDFANEYVNQGFTTIRDCGSSYNCVVSIKNAINAGIIKGPRLVSCGLIITPTEIGNDTFSDLYSEADGPEEIRKACRAELQKGNDFIKLMVSGAFMNEGADPGVQIAEPEEIEAAVRTARRKGTYVCAHCHGTSSIKAAILHGARTVEHGTFLDDECIELLRNNENTFLVPTGAVGLYCLDESNADVSPELLAISKKVAQTEINNINKAYQAGLKLGFGSDIDLEALRANPGYEFIARKEYYSFNDVDILIQATRNSAEIMGLGDQLGTIKEGKLADLVLVDGKPDQDIYDMAKPVVHVLKEGEVLK
ncbi:MAG: amidohydrolase family protein [Eubacteriales bacterium]|nr:amidohydrolase family protein [Eubacteriales bacterium]